VSYHSADSSALFDLCFAVPSGETDYNNNCYRIRGGTSTAPFIRKTVSGASTKITQMTNSLSANTYYDIAVDWVETGSQVDMSLRVWEWDGASWVEHDSEITGSDTGNNHAGEGGVAITTNNSDAGNSWLDYFRFWDTDGKQAAPSYTP